MMTPTRPLAAPLDVSEFLAVPTATLTQWRHRGKGPEYIRVGRHVRYRWSDVEKWLQQQRGGQGAA